MFDTSLWFSCLFVLLWQALGCSDAYQIIDLSGTRGMVAGQLIFADAPVEGALVLLIDATDPAQDIASATTTDRHGRFQLELLAGRKLYTILAAYRAADHILMTSLREHRLDPELRQELGTIRLARWNPAEPPRGEKHVGDNGLAWPPEVIDCDCHTQDGLWQRWCCTTPSHETICRWEFKRCGSRPAL